VDGVLERVETVLLGGGHGHLVVLLIRSQGGRRGDQLVTGPQNHRIPRQLDRARKPGVSVPLAISSARPPAHGVVTPHAFVL
jgi:hypothetical protein